MEVVPLFDVHQKGGGEVARNLYNEKPTEFPWKSWSLGVRAFKDHLHEVNENKKLFIGNKEVLPIEHWHSTFVHVYSTHADFSARFAARRTMNTTTANQIIDKMTDTYYLNKTLLLKCILGNEEDVPTINPAPAAVVPQERMLEEEQPNAMQLVATSGDGRRGTVATESFAAAQLVGNGNGASYYAEGSNPTINNYYSGAPSNNNNTTTATGTDNELILSLHTKLDDLGIAARSKLDNIEAGITAVRMSTTKKQRPAQTQRNDLGVLGRSNIVDEHMAAGGSPLRSTTLEDSPGKHSFEARDIGGRELFAANASGLRQSSNSDDSMVEDELSTGDDGTGALPDSFGENFTIQGSGENSPGSHGFEVCDGELFGANTVKRSNSFNGSTTARELSLTGEDGTDTSQLSFARTEPSGEQSNEDNEVVGSFGRMCIIM